MIKKSEDSPKLRPNVLRLSHLIVMAVAAMAPAGCILFNTIPQAGLVGAAIPLCYIIGLPLALLPALQMSEMAVELPASGSWYKFVTEGLGRYWGLISGWLGLLFYGIAMPFLLMLMSLTLQDLLPQLGLYFHWAVAYFLLTLLVWRVCCHSIQFSLKTELIFLTFEISVCLILAIAVLTQLGAANQLNLLPFTFTALPQNSNLFLGTVLAILGFLGFESVTTLSEEAQNPRQTVPQAMIIALGLVGAFYILISYVAVQGYGIENMAAFAQDATPFDAIARRFVGSRFAFIVGFTSIMAGYAGVIAFTNAAARMIYAVSRAGLLPRRLSHIHPIHRTPAHAILGLSLMSLPVGLSLGQIWSPIQAIGFFGTLLTLAGLMIYGLVSLACMRYFWVKRRERWNWMRHGFLPGCSLLAIGAVLVGTLYPIPPSPHRFAPVVLIVWLLLGIGLLRFLPVHRAEDSRRLGQID